MRQSGAWSVRAGHSKTKRGRAESMSQCLQATYNFNFVQLVRLAVLCITLHHFASLCCKIFQLSTALSWRSEWLQEFNVLGYCIRPQAIQHKPIRSQSKANRLDDVRWRQMTSDGVRWCQMMSDVGCWMILSTTLQRPKQKQAAKLITSFLETCLKPSSWQVEFWSHIFMSCLSCDVHFHRNILDHTWSY